MKTSKPTIQSDYPLLDVITNRWSTRAYSDKEVNDNEFRTLIEAARWAASCFNEQPWRFLYGKKGTEAFDQILSVLVKPNQSWAKNASFLVINVIQESFTKNGKTNHHAEHDLGLALGNLSAQATAMGLNIHHMAGLDYDAAKSTLEIPDGFKVLTAMSVGYTKSDEEMTAEEKNNELQPQQRLPIGQILCEGKFKF